MMFGLRTGIALYGPFCEISRDGDVWISPGMNIPVAVVGEGEIVEWPSPPPVSVTADEIIAAADRIAKAKRDRVVETISAAEMASWPIKRGEALIFQATSSAIDAPNLAEEAQIRGIELADLVGKVLDKAARLSSLEAAIAGRCGAIQDAARAARSSADLNAIDLDSGWPV